MKALLRMTLALLFAGSAWAQTDIEGDWRGKLAVDANTVLPVQFVFTKKPDGSYSAVLNSLDNQYIQNVAASSVAWKDGALKIDVPALSGAYVGTLKGDHFEGQWSQAGGKAIALALARRPQASRSDLDALTGNWQGTLPTPGNPTAVFEFKQDAKAGLTGTLSVPAQAQLGIPLTNLEVGPGTLSFKIAFVGGEYRATFSGTAMTGSFRQGGMPRKGAPLNLTKTAIATMQRLSLDGESWNALYGKWKGKVGGYETTLYFTTNGLQQVAFLDVPEQKGTLKATQVPVTSASVTGKKVALTVAAIAGEFSGDLAGKTLTGEWTQGGKTTSVTWTKQP
jgi:hypothetical protein